jgi:CubicO group peptidase (beta-lactamase class C family)
MKAKLLLLALPILLTTYAAAAGKNRTHDTILTAEFDRLLSSRFKPDGPGAAALVAQNGQIIYKKAFGLADLELKVAMQPDMIFRIGSITKQFTAVAILQLAEKGLLSLNDDITRYLPDFPVHGHKITIEHLLTHTSGIKSYTSLRTWDPMTRRRDLTPTELINLFRDEPMDFPPGTRFLYNNSGYILLGYIIEKVSGVSYSRYISDNIFKPAGMTSSGYDNASAIIPMRARGYQQGLVSVVNADFLSMTQPYAAGSLLSTVNDLYKWNRALHSYTLIRKETLESAFTSYKLSNGKETGYGYGWQLGNIQGSQSIEHGGGINGFLTHAIYLPDSDIFVTVFSNCTCNDPEMVTSRIAAAAIGKPFPEVELKTDISQTDEYTGVYSNEEGTDRMITASEGKIYSQVKGSGKYRMIRYATDRFILENSLTLLHFSRGTAGRLESVESLTRGGAPVTWKKTGDKQPSARKMITVATHILEDYTGEYELAAGFSLSITVVGNRIFAQGTGQGSNEIYPESETMFFLETVDAQIEFIRLETGEVNKLILYQGGQKMEAKRIK